MLSFLRNQVLVLNIISLIAIFAGCYKVACNKKIKHELKTPIWYAGIFAIFTSSMIMIQWLLGVEFPLAYNKIGRFGEVAMNVCLGLSAVQFIRKNKRKK
jgi:hypothetical protein